MPLLRSIRLRCSSPPTSLRNGRESPRSSRTDGTFRIVWVQSMESTLPSRCLPTQEAGFSTTRDSSVLYSWQWLMLITDSSGSTLGQKERVQMPVYSTTPAWPLLSKTTLLACRPQTLSPTITQTCHTFWWAMMRLHCVHIWWSLTHITDSPGQRGYSTTEHPEHDASRRTLLVSWPAAGDACWANSRQTTWTPEESSRAVLCCTTFCVLGAHKYRTGILTRKTQMATSYREHGVMQATLLNLKGLTGPRVLPGWEKHSASIWKTTSVVKQAPSPGRTLP